MVSVKLSAIIVFFCTLNSNLHEFTLYRAVWFCFWSFWVFSVSCICIHSQCCHNAIVLRLIFGRRRGHRAHPWMSGAGYWRRDLSRYSRNHYSFPFSFLLLHPPILEPDFHLSVIEAQRFRYFHTPGSGEVLIEMELFLQFGQLLSAEIGSYHTRKTGRPTSCGFTWK